MSLWRFLLGVIANGRRMEYNYGKTHDVGEEYGKQAEKPTPEANRYVQEEKLCVEARKQEKKHMTCVFREESK